MFEGNAIHLAWALLGLYLLVGLVVYERTGMRLGGVLVLPLLLVYALIDLAALLIFTVASVATYLVGNMVVGQTLAYGRRALYLYLLLGIGATALSNMVFGSPLAGFMLALLPGLYAYNLHREGTHLKGVSTFMVAFAGLLVVTVVGMWVLHTGTLPVAWLSALPDPIAAASAQPGSAMTAELDMALSAGLVTATSMHEALAEGAAE